MSTTTPCPTCKSLTVWPNFYECPDPFHQVLAEAPATSEKKLIARRGDLRREVERMTRRWFGEPVIAVEDELVDFITAEINREKLQWKQR